MNTQTPNYLDKNWKYVRSEATNIAETFKKFGYIPPSEQKVVEQEKK
jgi:hypothetical protein